MNVRGLVRRSEDKVRELDAATLGLSTGDISSGEPEAGGYGTFAASDLSQDWVYQRVQELFDDGFGGVILVGPPGTGKSWYARRISLALVDGDEERRRIVQFHRSYQYEDFVQGFVPREDGTTFELADKHLVQMCNVASGVPDQVCVLVVDELSRADVARVFGEALTYLEADKRGLPFYLASGRELIVPENLLVLATMNKLDLGVRDLDLALERRLAQIELEPDPEILEHTLAAHLPEETLRQLLGFFNWLQGHEERLARLGHAYFLNVRSSDALARLWEHQLKPHFKGVFAHDEGQFAEVAKRWAEVVQEE